MPDNGGVVHDAMHRELRADMAPLVELLVQIISTTPSPALRGWAAKELADLALTKTQESRTDSLTQLPNMLGLRILFDRLISEATRSPNVRQNAPDAIGVISMDLVGFGDYNLSIGWDAASQLLVDFARILETCLRRHDFVARQGGDEFIALLDLRKEQLVAGKVDTYQALLEMVQQRIYDACDAFNAAMSQRFKSGEISVFTPLELHARNTVITNADLKRRFQDGNPLDLAEIIRLADPKRRRN